MVLITATLSLQIYNVYVKIYIITMNFFDSVPFKRRRWWHVDQKVVYGLGHVYNDLCAAMWFSYMMLYFQAVLEMRAAVAGGMLLLGKI